MASRVVCVDCGAHHVGYARDGAAWARGHYCVERWDRETAEGVSLRARQQGRARAVRTARLAQDPDLAPHGDVTTYREWGCRCAHCTGAYTRMSVKAAKRRAGQLGRS